MLGVITLQILYYYYYSYCGHFYSALSPTTLGTAGCTRSRKACKSPFYGVVAAAVSLAVEEQSRVAIRLVHEALLLKRKENRSGNKQTLAWLKLQALIYDILKFLFGGRCWKTRFGV